MSSPAPDAPGLTSLTRRARLLGMLDVARSVGIEVGALHAPIVTRADGRIIYVDYASTETLRGNLRHPGVSPADVVEVDVVWGGSPLVELVGHVVDYVLGSHVIEHVPDLIGWLQEVHAVLRPGGILGLAVPDRRRTFDLYRRESGVSEMVEAHIRGYRRPSLRQVFEAAAFSKTDAQDAGWRPGRPGVGPPAEVLGRLGDVYRWAARELVNSDAYIDVHCWVFTPASFLDVADALAHMECFPFRIVAFHPTEADAIEFQVRLESVDPNDRETIRSSISSARRGRDAGHHTLMD